MTSVINNNNREEAIMPKKQQQLWEQIVNEYYAELNRNIVTEVA